MQGKQKMCFVHVEKRVFAAWEHKGSNKDPSYGMYTYYLDARASFSAHVTKNLGATSRRCTTHSQPTPQ